MQNVAGTEFLWDVERRNPRQTLCACCLPSKTTDLSPSLLSVATGQLILGLFSHISWDLSLSGYRRWPGHRLLKVPFILGIEGRQRDTIRRGVVGFLKQSAFPTCSAPVLCAPEPVEIGGLKLP